MWCPADAASPDVFDVVWDTPSGDSWGSMPVGNGDVGLNVWVEPTGDLVFYISKTDAFTGIGRLVKLGRIRVHLEPNPFADGMPFTQRLKLGEGRILIDAGPEGSRVSLAVWVDAFRPLIHVTGESDVSIEVTASAEIWRTEKRELVGTERISAYGLQAGPDPIFVQPDVVVDRPADREADRVVWYHRNEESIWADNLQRQALGPMTERLSDPLLGRQFGAMMQGDGLVRSDPTTLTSDGAVEAFRLDIHALTRVSRSAEAWVAAIEAEASTVEQTPYSERLTQHQAWWAEFWQRSWIQIDAAPSTSVIPLNQHAFHVGSDPKGGNRLVGEVGRVSVFQKALSEEEIVALAGRPYDAPLPDDPPAARFTQLASPRGPIADSADWQFPEGVTMEAWVRPQRMGGGGGRILDKTTPATGDGVLLDTYPGNSLRVIAGPTTFGIRDVLTPDAWHHVATVVSPGRDGEARLYHNGKLVAREATSSNDPAWVIGRGHALQRWMNACAGRGALPIKFNGSIFTVDIENRPGRNPIHGRLGYNADYRDWGGCYWFQNTRLPYWSMLATGDHDLMRPLFDMYVDAMPLRREATRAYYGHAGIFYPETMYFWGTYNNSNYGYSRGDLPADITVNQYIRRYWQGGIELLAMMLDYHDQTLDATFRDEVLLPYATETIAFFDEHWPRDDQGVIRFHPSQSLETWWDATNPMPEIAGLRYCLPRLIALVDDGEQRAGWERCLTQLPPIPIGESEGLRFLIPAETYAQKRNVENPELYAIFPYRMFGLGKPDLDVAREAFARRANRRSGGWQQNAIQAALLGLTDEAAAMVTHNFSTSASGFRFPAFWGPNYDWVPDQDHGGVAMTALHRMLLQTEGHRIHLLPAWPTDWDVHFKLHAPGRTTIECVYREGRVERLEVTPPERRADVVLE